MKNKILFSTLIIGALALAACSDDTEEAVENLTQTPELQGEFESECAPSTLKQLTNFSTKEVMTYTGNSINIKHYYYSDDSCSEGEQVGVIALEGEFILEKDVKEGSDIGGIEYQIQKVTVTPKTDALINVLNTVNFCGKSDYSSDEEVEIKESSDDLLCPVTDVPETFYGIYKVNDGKLYLSESDITEMATNKEDRSTEVGDEPKFTKK